MLLRLGFAFAFVALASLATTTSYIYLSRDSLHATTKFESMDWLDEWLKSEQTRLDAFCDHDPTFDRIARLDANNKEIRPRIFHHFRAALKRASVGEFSLRNIDGQSINQHRWPKELHATSQELRFASFQRRKKQAFRLVYSCSSRSLNDRKITLDMATPFPPTWMQKKVHLATAAPSDALFRNFKDLSGETIYVVSNQRVSTSPDPLPILLRALAFGLAVALFLTWLFTQLFAREMKFLVEKTQEIRSTLLGQTIGTATHDSASKTHMVGVLQNELEGMAAALADEQQKREQEQKRALRAERVAAWRHVGRLVAHEIKNPLSPIQLSMQTLRKAHQRNHPDFDEIFDESVTAVLQEVERMKNLVNEFSTFARLPRPRVKMIDLHEVTESIVAMHQQDGLSLSLVGETLEVRADPDQIRQALLNLIQNAIEESLASGQTGGALVRVTIGEEDTHIRIDIEDNGRGVDESLREKVFEPYYTGKTSGTGLGLAMVQRIAEDHDGSVEVTTSELGGALFILRLSKFGPLPEVEATATSS